MNRESLRTLLDSEGIDPRAYSLDGGFTSDVYVLEEVKSNWAVFYSERGRRWDESEFSTEGEACEDILERLLNDPLARREKWR